VLKPGVTPEASGTGDQKRLDCLYGKDDPKYGWDSVGDIVVFWHVKGDYPCGTDYVRNTDTDISSQTHTASVRYWTLIDDVHSEALRSAALDLLSQAEAVAIPCGASSGSSSSSSSSSPSSPSSPSEYESSQAELDKICENIWGTGAYYDPKIDDCVADAEKDRRCKATGIPYAYYDPVIEKCNTDWDRLCKDNDKIYDADKEVCVKPDFGGYSSWDEYCKETNSSEYSYDVDTNQCLKPDFGGYSSWDAYCKGEFSEFHSYDADKYQCIRDMDVYCKEEHGLVFDASQGICVKSQQIIQIPTMESLLPSTDTKIFVPSPSPQIKEEAKPFWKALIDGEKCGELNNLAEIGFGLERAHLLCSDESVNLPTGHTLKVKLADDFHIKLGKWALEKTVKFVIVTVGGAPALAAVETLEELTGYGDAKKIIKTFNTVSVLVTDGKGSFFNGVIEFEFSCPTGDCKIWRMESKGDSSKLIELPGIYDPLLKKVFAQSEHMSVFIVVVYESQESTSSSILKQEPCPKPTIELGDGYNSIFWGETKGGTNIWKNGNALSLNFEDAQVIDVNVDCESKTLTIKADVSKNQMATVHLYSVEETEINYTKLNYLAKSLLISIDGKKQNVEITNKYSGDSQADIVFPLFVGTKTITISNLSFIPDLDTQTKSIGDTTKVKEKVPGWVKNNAKWWAEGTIGDSEFTSGIQHLIKEKIIDIPDLPEQASDVAEEKVPDWIRNNAKWWADGQISEDDFVNGIKYLVEKGIVRVN